MMSSMTKYFFIIIFVLFSCSKNEEGKRRVEYHLNKVNTCIEGSALSANQYYSVFVLEQLTGVSSSVSFGEVSFYTKKEDVKTDIKNWSEWLKKNEAKQYNLSDSIKIVESLIREELDWLDF